MSVIDLFAGPGGWDLAAHELGLNVLGIEFDDAACQTRRAAGLATVQADVSTMVAEQGGISIQDDVAQQYHHWPLDEITGLIASPPCQAFSMAGKGEGRKALDEYADLAWHWFDLSEADRAKKLKRIGELCDDERAHLVMEPLRWAEVLDPDWIALEQVEPVLPIWQAMSQALMDRGYWTWSGVLSAEQYGVPQTRRRAFLIARKRELGVVNMPPATHQRYIAPRTKSHDKQEASLFDDAGVDVGERTRVVHPQERHLLPWVSMAEALGWVEGPSPSPSPTLTAGGGATGGIEPFASKGARERASAAVVATRGESGRDNDEFDPNEQPSRTITGKSDSWALRAGTNANDAERTVDEPAPTMRFGARLNNVSWRMRANAQANAAVRSEDEPSPTITGGHDTGERVWEPADGKLKTHANTRPNEGEGRHRPDGLTRNLDEPAPTVDGRASGWTADRPPTHLDSGQSEAAGNVPRPTDEPSPTVTANMGHIHHWTEEPTRRSGEGALIGRQLPEGEGKNVGGKNWVDGRPSTTVAVDHEPGQQSQNAVRVTQREAAILQSFPPDYPWQGSKTKQFQQIGNAVPPLLALAVLEAVVPSVARQEAYIGCEREPEYVAIAEARIAWWAEHPEGVEFADRVKAERARKEREDSGQFDLFGEEAA